MTKSESQLRELLVQVRQKNDSACAEYTKVYGLPITRQIIHPAAEPVGTDIPTLARGVTKKMTPMLLARFQFADTWEDTAFGFTWLGLKSMKQLWTDETLLSPVKVRQEHWDASPPALHSLDRLSLFGVDYTGGEEIYLIWPDEPGVEPSVVAYYLDIPHEFPHLAACWENLLSEKLDFEKPMD